MIAKATALESIMRMMAATRQLWACMDAPARPKFRTQIQTDPRPQVAEGNILPRLILRRGPKEGEPAETLAGDPPLQKKKAPHRDCRLPAHSRPACAGASSSRNPEMQSQSQ